MPDLNLIKQAEQGARDRRGRFEKGRSRHPARCRIGSRNNATLPAGAFRAGESEALTRRAVEFALAGDPTAMRLCLERILPPCRERAVKFALPPIESAPIGQSPWAEGPQHRRGDEGGHLGAGQWRDHAGRGGEDRAVVDTFVRAIDASDFDRRLQELEDASKARGGSHCGVGIALALQPIGEWFAADLLQVQQRETIGSILDCKSWPWPLAGRHAFCDHSRRDGVDDHRG